MEKLVDFFIQWCDFKKNWKHFLFSIILLTMFNVVIPEYKIVNWVQLQYKNHLSMYGHYTDKRVARQSSLYNGNSLTATTVSLYGKDLLGLVSYKYVILRV